MTTRRFLSTTALPDEEEIRASSLPIPRRQLSSDEEVRESSTPILRQKTNDLLKINVSDPELFKPNCEGFEVIFYLEAISRNGYAVLTKSEAEMIRVAEFFGMRIAQFDYPYLGHYQQLMLQMEAQKIKFFGSNEIVPMIESLKGKVSYYVATKDKAFLGIILIQ